MPDDTRDIAVESRQAIRQHMDDCTRVRDAIFGAIKELRVNNTSSINGLKDDTKDMIDGLKTDTADSIKELRQDNKKQNWIIAGIVGGITTISTMLELVIAFHH